MKSPWNRREFIGRPLAWLAASSLLSESELLHAATPASASAAGGVVQRTLGRTGIQLPIVSMGVMNANMAAVVKRAYEMGMRHFDTAAVYQNGRNEEMLGQVIKEQGLRDKVVIATKVLIKPPNRRSTGAGNEFRSIFEGSLKRLQMDHVDILYYHAVDEVENVGPEEILATLAAVKKEGKTRFIGISTHNVEPVLNAAVALGVYDVALVTINYTMAANKGLLDSIDAAAKKGVGIVAMKTQAGGTTKPDPKLPSVLPPHSQTALLKWVLQNPSITTAIPGFTNFDQLEQNFSVARDLTFTPAEKEFLADKSFRAQAEFCVQCGKCREDCPLRAEIPTLMRSHMYAVQYANRGLARETLASIGSGKGLDACGSCSSCRATCRETVNIARKIAELKAITAAGALEA